VNAETKQALSGAVLALNRVASALHSFANLTSATAQRLSQLSRLLQTIADESSDDSDCGREARDELPIELCPWPSIGFPSPVVFYVPLLTKGKNDEST
jgi:hypothetical protein